MLQWHHRHVTRGWVWGALLRRSLLSPTAVTWPVWAWILPLVALDSLAIDFLATGAFEVSRTLQWVGALLLAYVIGGLWFILGRQLRPRLRGRWRLFAVLLVYGAAGATWVGLAFWLMRDAVSVPTIVTLIAGAALGLVSFTAITVALSSRKAAQRTGSSLQRAQQESERNKRDLQAVSLVVRQRNADWIRNVLAPRIDALLERMSPLDHIADPGWVDSEAGRIAQSVDDLRESVVRATSQRMHPATRVLGARATLTAVVKGHQQVRSELHLDGDTESTPESVVGIFGRAVDLWLTDIVLLSTKPCVIVRVTATSQQDVLEMTGGQMDTVEGSLVLRELQARLMVMEGTIQLWETHEGLAHLVVTVPRSRARHLPPTTSPTEVSIPALSALVLFVPTACVVTVMDGRPLVVLACALAAMSVAIFSSVALRLAPGILKSSVLRLVASFVAPVALATSVVVTLAWFGAPWLLGSPATTNSAIVLSASNALVVASVLSGTIFFRRSVQRWQENIEASIATASGIRESCIQLAKSIDTLRESVSQVMHGSVQARLIVASARMESCARGTLTDLPSAKVALRLIRDVDIPRIMLSIEGRESSLSVTDVISDLSQSLGIKVTLAATVAPSSLADARIIAIVQEGVINAVRHGGSSRIHVVLEDCPDGARVRVEDDGRGAGTGGNGLGLAMINAITDGGWALDAIAGGSRLTATVRG